jgi:hypothetical protein
LARRHEFFFTRIWPVENIWHHRDEALGDRVLRLLTSLQQLYWRTPSTTAFFHLLAFAQHAASAQPESSDKEVQSIRRQVSHDLARRLETPGNMVGHFYHLRHSACQLLLKPLAATVRTRDTRSVQADLASLRRKLANGEAERLVLDAIGNPKLRPAHTTSLHRYLASSLDAVDAWLTEEVSLTTSQQDVSEAESVADWRSALSRLTAFVQRAAAPTTFETVEWLEHELVDVLINLKDGSWPDPAFAFFGDLAVPESLFAFKQPTRRGSSRVLTPLTCNLSTRRQVGAPMNETVSRTSSTH